MEVFETLLEEIKKSQPSTNEEIEKFRVAFLGKKGKITLLMPKIKDLPPEKRKEFGKNINILKKKVQEKILLSKEMLPKEQKEETKIDFSMPVSFFSVGARHPISIVKSKIISIFENIGFSLSEGPEIEDDWHNFSALNFEENHPARDMQDTFFVDFPKEHVLRTHTSSVQVRMMEKYEPPLKILSPGRVYRKEAISARSHCFFHQIEGLYVAENVTFVELKNTIYHFVQELFGKETQIRFRPSYFPFTEPSSEVDISCTMCSGKGCRVCKKTGWLEILGCGLVDPNVLQNCGIDPKKYTGYAFGMGLERISMLQYSIPDIRLLFENDVRFLSQFKADV